MAKNEETFSGRLKRLLSEKNISLRAAARIAGVSPATLTNWTSNGTPTDFQAVKKLAAALNTSFSFLMIGEEEAIRKLASTPSITEVFSEGAEIYNGYARIVMVQMVPRKPDDGKQK